MSLKKQLGLGVASAALGLSLVGGGTYAYFSDTATETGTFAAGTLDINTDPSVMVGMDNLKPGDKIYRTFKLKNDGSLDIKKILLDTAYTVNDTNGNNGGDDFGKHIRVDILANVDKASAVIWSDSLYNLKNGPDPDAVAAQWFSPEGSGIKAKTFDNLFVVFTFVENNQDQNKFQGDSLNLTWTFNAQQGNGEWK
ncbi:TasA family protein [Fictibacillus iocasae]|uniref:TasA family protein n=1 Tax=Fictibacillus iocasae TaxID=2715437 RepID=A0ABW2NNR5_9BACL